MKYGLLILLLAFSVSANAQLPDKEIYDLKGGRVKPDFSPVYHFTIQQGQ